jgi:hypothetical protein
VDALPSTDSDDALRAIADPMQRALRLRAITRSGGRLTADQQQIYRDAIAELRGDGERKQIWIARKLDLSRGRIGQLLGSKTAQTEGVAA